jgi:peptidoglycan/xylan/chitin deacetylase (PgdA/CDA1 family)
MFGRRGPMSMWLDPLSKRLLKNAGAVSSRNGRGPVVLMYHSIARGDKMPESRWSVSEKHFLEQLRLLKAEGWTTACVRDLEGAELLPPRTVVITFDDGYEDNFKCAFRHLSAAGMKATWFLVSGYVGTWSGWKDPDSPVRRMLISGQLKEMAAAGMEIGAHTRTHVRLPGLDFTKIWDEVDGSKRDLEEIVGRPVTSFAYPYGLFDGVCSEAVRKAGFRVACTTRTGWFGSEPDLLQVRRVAIFHHDTLSAFARKLAFADTSVDWPKMTRYALSRVKDRLMSLR